MQGAGAARPVQTLLRNDFQLRGTLLETVLEGSAGGDPCRPQWSQPKKQPIIRDTISPVWGGISYYVTIITRSGPEEPKERHW